MRLALRHKACLGLLLIALVFCQWLGQWHAIAHFSNSQEHVATSQQEVAFVVFDHVKKSNACVVLDAVTHGANLHTPYFAADFGCIPNEVVTTFQFALWLPVFTGFFSSRAPPTLS